MCRWVSREKLWPGEISPLLAKNAESGDVPPPPYGLPPPPPPPPPPTTALPPSRRVTCWSVISVTHTSAIPATIAADPNPIEPAAPPPPEVNDAAKRTSGTPSVAATCAGSHANE